MYQLYKTLKNYKNLTIVGIFQSIGMYYLTQYMFSKVKNVKQKIYFAKIGGIVFGIMFLINFLITLYLLFAVIDLQDEMEDFFEVTGIVD